MEKILYQFSFIGSGIFVTLEILLGTLVISFLLGVTIAVLKYKNSFLWLIKPYVSIIRGTPMILQLSFIYFSLPLLLHIKISVVAAGIITFGMNSAAYVSEILRSGIESLPKGQFEAAQSLRIPAFYMWRDIILPQVIANVLPAIINEVITLVKDTALVSTIGGFDIMRRSQAIAAQEFTYFLPLAIAGCYYYFMVLSIETLGAHLAKKLNYTEKN